MERLQEVWDLIVKLFGTPLFEIGETSVTLWGVLYPLILVVLFIYLVNRTHRWVVYRLLSRSDVDLGTREAIGNIFRYGLLATGFVIILQTTGIDLTVLNVLAGTLGIGIGFGLQNVINNFVSGLIILFERPIKVGDRIELGNVHGQVTRIGARSTTILTNDNISIVVPNLKFITENVVNWSRAGSRVRFRIPVMVAHGTDPYLVERLLVEAVLKVPDVLSDPEPGVRLLAFTENGLQFELRVWSSALLQRRGLLTSKLNYAIHDKLAEHGIEIPHPQRDVYLHNVTGEDALS
ncbi:MAG: mechanosensitive ion channel family protein [Anaerolineales bacterium]